MLVNLASVLRVESGVGAVVQSARNFLFFLNDLIKLARAEVKDSNLRVYHQCHQNS